ncbi:hypothetical protein RIF29_16670 [Crotalaria pallida]|uniref:Uncharacterized protein n=1 Tax=Crotalaria pallida TaxID=3830 RepID=A0AAN9FJ89_CROPI
MKPPKYKVKTKGGVKGSRKEAAHEKSTKREPSHWEDDVMEGPEEHTKSRTRSFGTLSDAVFIELTHNSTQKNQRHLFFFFLKKKKSKN